MLIWKVPREGLLCVACLSSLLTLNQSLWVEDGFFFLGIGSRVDGAAILCVWDKNVSRVLELSRERERDLA